MITISNQISNNYTCFEDDVFFLGILSVFHNFDLIEQLRVQIFQLYSWDISNAVIYYGIIKKMFSVTGSSDRFMTGSSQKNTESCHESLYKGQNQTALSLVSWCLGHIFCQRFSNHNFTLMHQVIIALAVTRQAEAGG